MSLPRNHPSPLQEGGRGQDEGPPQPLSPHEPAGAGGPGAPPCPRSTAGGLRRPGCLTGARHASPTPGRPHPPGPGAPSPPVPPAAISGRRQFKKRAAAPTPPLIGCRPTAPLHTAPSFATAARYPAHFPPSPWPSSLSDWSDQLPLTPEKPLLAVRGFLGRRTALVPLYRAQVAE